MTTSYANPVRYVVKYIWREGGVGHEHITQVYVVDTWSSDTGTWWSVEKAHDFVDGIGPGNGSLWVLPVSGNPAEPAAIVYPRKTVNGRKYVQTKADGIWTNNLLALPDLSPIGQLIGQMLNPSR